MLNSQTTAELEQLLEETQYGELVPWEEYPANDWDGGTVRGSVSPFVTINDRKDGDYYPIFQNEQDLSRIVGSCRRFIGLSELCEAVMSALRVYVFGSGIQVSVQAARKVEVPPELVDDVRRIVETFCEQNSVVNNLDLEMDKRAREDGECFLPIEREGNSILCDPIETVQVSAPPSPDVLYDWINSRHEIDCYSFDPSWKYGILTSQRRTARPLGYHVFYSASGADYEFFPTDQMVHVKRNVPRGVKRGVPDWLACKDRMAQVAKLQRNLAHGNALRAAIAWVEQSPAGTGNNQLGGIGSPGGFGRVPNGQGNTRQNRQVQYGPGSILRPSPGREYLPFLSGPDHNDGFVLIEQMLVRLIGTRWNMTYPMISGDASAVNFAASLTAEAPFVKRCEADQQFYGGALKSLLWKVVKLAWRHGWLDMRGVPFSRLASLIDIKVDFVSPATRDRGALVDQLTKEVALGVTSRRTASVQLDRDYDEEVAAGAAPATPSGQPASGPMSTIVGAEQPAPGEMANLSAQQFDRNTRAILKILQQFKDGKTSRVLAKGMLNAINVPDAKADEYLTDAADGTIDAPELQATSAAVQGALESVETTDEARQILSQLEGYP